MFCALFFGCPPCLAEHFVLNLRRELVFLFRITLPRRFHGMISSVVFAFLLVALLLLLDAGKSGLCLDIVQLTFLPRRVLTYLSPREKPANTRSFLPNSVVYKPRWR
jgi:hypothetical protein